MTLLFALSATLYAAKRQPVWTLTLPFGGPQYAAGLRKRGLIYTGVQGAGVGVATWSSIRMWQAYEAEDLAAERRYRMISWGSVAFAAAGWMGSVMDGSNYYQLQKQELERARQAWYSVPDRPTDRGGPWSISGS